MTLAISYYLVGLVALAGEEYGAALRGKHNGSPDGFPAVLYAEGFCKTGRAHSRLDFVYDLCRALTAAVVGSEYDSVGVLFGNRAHLGTLGPVPVAPATEETDTTGLRTYVAGTGLKGTG